MAKAVTLTTLMLEAREHADMVNSTFVSDAELTRYINKSYDELWDLLTSTVEGYGITTSTFTIATGNTEALPATFYKLNAIDDMQDSSHPRTVLPYNFQERNDYPRIAASGGLSSSQGNVSNVRYRIIGSNLVFEPSHSAPGDYKIWWTPCTTDLSAGSDTVDGVSGWTEYIAVDAAIKCLRKEESSTTALQAAKDALTKRILAMAPARDQASPQKITRVRNRNRLGYNSRAF